MTFNPLRVTVAQFLADSARRYGATRLTDDGEKEVGDEAYYLIHPDREHVLHQACPGQLYHAQTNMVGCCVMTYDVALGLMRSFPELSDWLVLHYATRRFVAPLRVEQALRRLKRELE